MSVRAMTWAWEQEDVPPNAKYVLIALADNADEDGQSWPGRRYLTRKTGIKKAETISKHLATLRELGKLTVQPQYALENGSRATNLYRLHMAPSKLGGAPPDIGIGVDPIQGLGTPPKGGLGTPPKAGLGTPPKAGLGTPPKAGLGTPPKAGLGTPPKAGLGTPRSSYGANPDLGMALKPSYEPSLEPSDEPSKEPSVESGEVSSLPDQDGEDVWKEAMEMIRAQTSRPAFETWVANTTGMGFFPDGVFGVKAPNGFIAEMLNDRMYLVIAGVLGDVLGREVEVRFIDESQDQRGRV